MRGVKGWGVGRDARPAIERGAAGAAVEPHDSRRRLRDAFASNEVIVEVCAACNAEVAGKVAGGQGALPSWKGQNFIIGRGCR